MAEITRVPLGLQKALGLQTQGDNPSALSQTISPGIDFQRYYDFRQTYFWNKGTTFTAIGVVEVAVPLGEIWILRQMAVAVRPTGTTAGDLINLDAVTFNVQQSDDGTQFHAIGTFGTVSDVGGGGASYYSARTVDPDGIVLFGGSTIRLAATRLVLTSGSFICRFSGQYIRIQI